jgi:metal-sulfur cluster biosynthetic enzyme
MVTKSSVENVLKTIPDPELGVSIFDLGLIYTIEVHGTTVEILMTLTTVGCPLFDQIAGSIRKELGKLQGVKKVEIHLTFEPPWKPDMMSTEAKMQLGFN